MVVILMYRKKGGAVAMGNGLRAYSAATEPLIVNCLPLTDEERGEFIEAADGVRQIFVLDPAQRGRMQWPMRLPEGNRDEVTIIFGNPPADQVADCQNLAWLQTLSAGVDAYLQPGLMPDGALLTSASGAYGQSVSEEMFAMMWALMKDLPAYRDNQNKGLWKPRGAVYSPRGAKALVLGTGDLGSSFARLVKAVGGTTYGIRRHPDKQVDGFDHMAGTDRLDQLLPDMDIVALALPASTATHHIISKERLALMKQNAVLVNAGRGDAVDCLALAETLEAGRILGAGLDVTEPEPLPADHPLWSQPRCLITPHVAGGAHLASNVDKIIEICLDNLRRYRAGQPLRNRVR